jgi:polar amino acid transport system substrate-binding protein
MRKIRFTVVPCLVLSLVFTVFATAGTTMDRIRSKGELVVGTTGAQPPMTATTRDGDLIGWDVDIARAMADALGVKVRFVRLPFPDLLPALGGGKVDVVLSGMTITPDRNREYAFAGPYYVSGKGLLAKSDRYAALQESKGLNAPGVTVVALKNSTSQQYAEALMPKANRVWVEAYEAGIDMVIAGKADVLVADFPFCALTAFRHRDQGLAAGKSPLTFEPLGIALPEDALLINWAQNFLGLLEGSGEMEKMREKWLKGGSWVNDLP